MHKRRREFKKRARCVLKTHYWLFVMLCLIAGMIGTEFTTSVKLGKDAAVSYAEAENTVNRLTTDNLIGAFYDNLEEFNEGKEAEQRARIDEKKKRYEEESKKNENAVLGRSRGVFSGIVNKAASGEYIVTLAVAVRSLVGSDNIAAWLLIVVSLALIFFVQTFIVDVYQIVMRRMLLEGRCYKRVPLHRVWFLMRVRKWMHAGVTLLLKQALHTVWGLTVIGGVVKYYSYYLVPYIAAENPSIKAADAITLSRQMMDGHKWECFVMELSFWGWRFLGFFTMGIANIFYINPFMAATMAEYYVSLREEAIDRKFPLAEQLNDRYLYEHPEQMVLDAAYEDVREVEEEPPVVIEGLTGVQKFLANTLGITVLHQKEMDALEEEANRKFRVVHDIRAYKGIVYPTRLYPISEVKRNNLLENMNFLRHYSIWSVIMMFFIMSFAGWVWEVSLHFLTKGCFVNRGVLHGPWLPIYGAGSVLILLLLNRLRRKPVAEFIAAVALCGFIEYYTSYFLEIITHGKRWWDYHGYFLNLNGRICAEGLLTFGIGGVVMVYVLAPFLDNLIRRLPMRRLIALCVLLLVLFGADQMWSVRHPNEGKGISKMRMTAVRTYEKEGKVVKQ